MDSILISLITLILIISSAYLFFKIGLKAVFLYIPVVALCLFFFGYEKNFSNFFLLPILGSISGYSIREGKDLKFFIIISALAASLIFSGSYYYMLHFENKDMLKISKVEMSEMLDKNKSPEDVKKKFLNDYDNVMIIMRDLMPFASFIYGLFISSLIYFFVKFVLHRFEIIVPAEGLELFRLNDYLVFVLITAWGTALLVDKAEYYLIYTGGLNIALTASALYIVQALGVIKFFLLKKGLPVYLLAFSFLLVILIGMEATIFIAVILTGLGTLDFWADFRKLSLNKNLDIKNNENE